MQKTMSHPARSGIELTIFAPSFASGSAFERVRFHTAMSQPPLARRLAMSKPMRPAPIQPIFAFLPALNSRLLRSFRRRLDDREHRAHGDGRPRLDQDGLQHAVRDGGNFGGDLVGFHVEERLVRLHGVAHFLVPVGHRAFGDRLAELRHDHVHCFSPYYAARPKPRFTSATIRATVGTTASSSWSAEGSGTCGVVI